VSYADLSPELMRTMPELRGRLRANSLLSQITWFRVGGPAQILFTPADETDLAYFLKNLPQDLPVTVIGLGSNLLVRDGGISGIVIRLGKGFGFIEPLEGHRLRVGTVVPDVKVARAAANAGISGLAFYRGIPGCVGGALRMNAGAHGTETKDALLSARAVDRAGRVHELSNADMGFSYRNNAVAKDWIFTEAVYGGEAGDPAQILKQMDEVADYRETHQPIKERTGGSTFKNPEGLSAWKLIDEAGCRGLRIGGAKVSDKHCNFLINEREATSEDIETLGETVRHRVKQSCGVTLNWEIKRLGLPLAGHAMGEALARTTNEA